MSLKSVGNILAFLGSLKRTLETCHDVSSVFQLIFNSTL